MGDVSFMETLPTPASPSTPAKSTTLDAASTKTTMPELAAAFGPSKASSRQSSPRHGSRPQTQSSARTAKIPPALAWNRAASRDKAAVGAGLKVGPEDVQAAQYSWSHSHMQYLPNLARKEAEESIAAAHREAARLRVEAENLAKERDDANRRAAEAEVEAMRQVRQASWASEQRSQEQEDRIAALERLLEEERQSHKAEQQRLHDLVDTARAEAERRVRDAEQRCANAAATAARRAEEAERRMEEKMGTADRAIDDTRAREAARVQQAQRDADTRVQEALQDQRAEVARARQEVMLRKREMQDELYMNKLQKNDALREAERHLKELEAQAEAWQALKEGEYQSKQAKLDAAASAQKRHLEELEVRHKDLLDLEKHMHLKTVERTMNRVVRRLRLGNHDFDPRGTPTFQVLRGLLDAPCETCGATRQTPDQRLPAYRRVAIEDMRVPPTTIRF